MIKPFRGLGDNVASGLPKREEGNPLTSDLLSPDTRPLGVERNLGMLDASVMTNPESFVDAESSRRDSRPLVSSDPPNFLSVPRTADDDDDEEDPAIDEDTVHQLLAQSGVVDELGALTIEPENVD